MKIVRAFLLPPKRKPREAAPVAAPVPRPFDFGFTERRPLVPLPAVMMFLDRSANEVIELIEDGKLRWAFDIRTTKAGSREVRILRQSLFEYTGLYVREPEADKLVTEKEEEREIMNLILPEGTMISSTSFQNGSTNWRKPVPQPVLRKLRVSVFSFQKMLFPSEPVLWGTEIAQCFSCNSQHIINLVRENSISAVNLRRGPKASPIITRGSVIEFLKKRRMA